MLNLAVAGAFLYGALYLVAVLVLGVLTGSAWAVGLALLGLGLSYLCECATALVELGADRVRGFGVLLWLAAIGVGTAAGIVVLLAFAKGG